jgi:glucan phosphoethanolaminetransferase (alkaline phosphatase superfamily)
MRLKLFRSTGYSTLLMPGEARLAPHPGWVVLGVSLWLALACNVALWRELAGSARGTGIATALLAGAAAGGAAATVLSLLAWRRTLKLAATVLLLLGALLACGMWIQSVPVTETLWSVRWRTLLPSWASLLRWQVPALVIGLGVLPAVVVWNLKLRRLTGPAQLRANFLGAAIGAAVMFAGALASN